MEDKPRTELELVKVILNHFKKLEYIGFGICSEIYTLNNENLISDEELDISLNIIYKNVNQEDSRTKSHKPVFNAENSYYWETGNIEPRLQYLEYLIEKYS